MTIGGWESQAPPRRAIRVERVIDATGGAAVIGSVRHDGHAWAAEAPVSDAGLADHCWADIGRAYLQDLEGVAGLQAGSDGWLHPDVRAALMAPRQPGSLAFGWLGLTWLKPLRERRLTEWVGPLGSFWVPLGDAGSAERPSGTLVLLAGNVDEQHQLQFGDDFGLRIVMHVARGRARVLGVTLSGLAGAHVLRAVPSTCPWREDPAGLGAIKQAIGLGLDCDGRVWVNNIEQVPDRPDVYRVCGQAMRGRHQRDAASGAMELKRNRVHDFRAEVERSPQGMRLTRVLRDDYLGSAITVRAFVADPMSQPAGGPVNRRRPTLPADAPEWNEWRSEVELDLEAGVRLRFDDGGPCFEARGPSRGAASTVRTQAGAVQTNGAPPLMSDEQGSIEAHVRAAELFDRLNRYGFDPAHYFRFARLPLVHRVRPQMIWAPDGELPNADVRVFLGEDLDPATVGDRPQLLVRYGAASPRHRRKLPLPDGSGRVRAHYLSVASDPRWAWHEFGHVLNFASTGELEFPFAHSCGDALAAIVSDPRSRLAGQGHGGADRFGTFPWIEVPGRSHGRCVAEGYGWCGHRNLVRLARDPEAERYHHSYFGEQLMSSSLFRLYRSLGGDTRAPSGRDPAGDLATRLSASDYCVYLVMRAIALLGPDSLAPARTAEQFVSALIDADRGTGIWEVVANWPYDMDERHLSRRGGRVHKVIRWAFEEQGLYATDDPAGVAEGRGLPPSVDLFLADRRDPGGGYAPAPLRAAGARPQDWHADDLSLRRQGRGLRIRLGNRGRHAAQHCAVRVWWRSEARGHWQGGSRFDVVGQVSGRGWQEVDIPLPDLPRSAAWVLVAADSPADPSNLGPADRPPTRAGDLLELVAHDNNLALARLPAG
ncbi:MAG: hypothetical protein U1F56_25730 [Rubrivivax sp.]